MILDTNTMDLILKYGEFHNYLLIPQTDPPDVTFYGKGKKSWDFLLCAICTKYMPVFLLLLGFLVNADPGPKMLLIS